MSKLLNVLVNNIKHYASGTSLNDLSKISGVPQSTLSRLFSEQTNPSLDTIEKVAIGLNTEPYTLLIDKIGFNKRSYSIPPDIMELLDNQPDSVYDSIRTILKTFNSVKQTERKFK